MAKASPTRADSPAHRQAPSAREERLVVSEQAENFPVALRLLPKTLRSRLQAIYDVVRVIDDLGDTGDGDRTAALIAFRDQLATVWSDQPPTSGPLGRLVRTVRACHLDAEPFNRLIEANLQDQTVKRYPRRTDLIGYCALSADPVGRLVLAITGASSPQTVARSDQICTALQVIEHCQDIGEDYLQDRIYLPLEDLDRFGLSQAEFGAAVAGGTSPPALRRLIEFEAGASAALLHDGEPLLGLLHGAARLAVTGYLAGGYATLDALRTAGWQVLPSGPRPRRRDVVRHAVRLLITARRHR